MQFPMSDFRNVDAQYASEAPLSVRMSVWRPTVQGRSPQDDASAAVRATDPRSVLDVGCGTGVFAARLAAQLPPCRVLAVDQSQQMAKVTAARGIAAHRGDVLHLAFADGVLDVVTALWMLYHVADLDRGLREIRRVLRPGGLFVAVTNGDAHLAGLLTEAGGSPILTGFSSENGAAALGAHFQHVEQTDLATRAVFPDHDAAVAYLATFDSGLAAGLPWFEGSREYAGATTMFVAR